MDARTTAAGTIVADAQVPGTRRGDEFNLNDVGGGLIGLAYAAWGYFVSWMVVKRHDDVREVFSKDDVFEVPFGAKIMELNGGPNFLLGMSRADPNYKRYYEHVAQAFRREDIGRVQTLAAKLSEQILLAKGNRFDAIEELITRVPTRLCRDYYGLIIDRDTEVQFAHWAIAMSSSLFGPPVQPRRCWNAARAGAARLRKLVDDSIHAAHASGAMPDTVLARLIAMQGTDQAKGPTDTEIRTYLIGMVTGFVPTNSIGAGNALEMLLRREDFMARTRAAALDGNDDLLWRCLFEAMRFKPLPGHYRVCSKDYTIAAGSGRARNVKAGKVVFLNTEAAMTDEESVELPRKFNPERPRSDYFLFGYGLHWCVGAHIAEAQTVQVFKALLTKGLPRRAGKLKAIGVFPLHLDIELVTQ